MNNFKRVEDASLRSKDNQNSCPTCRDQNRVRHPSPNHIFVIEKSSNNDKKELTSYDLNSLEKMLAEALTKTSDVEKMRENVIFALKTFDASQFSWDRYYNYVEKGYTRNLVIENELFELLIICWDSECQTPIHDHPSDGCWIVGVEGKIFEKKYKREADDTLTIIEHSEFGFGEIGYMHDSIGLHSVGNTSKTERAATLHLYSPPIRKCHAYQENGVKIPRVLKYYSKNRGNNLG